MNLSDVVYQRLNNQRLTGEPFTTPEDVVRSLGAVQAQDYPGAKWALGQRVLNGTDAEVNNAYNQGRILRTHVMRPTWHFVLPEDIRWMQELTAPRVKAISAYYFRKFELDDAIFQKSEKTIVQALEGGNQLTRLEIKQTLQDAGINADGLRLGYLIIGAELDALICSGAMRGKQHTYALLTERAPQANSLPHDEALAKLTKRYFTSHGPALVQDFAWWSGLTATEVKVGLELVKSHLDHAVIDGKTYWFAPSTPEPFRQPLIQLLPNYDEYLIAYKDRPAFFDASQMTSPGSREMAFANHIILLDGKLLGGWRRIPHKGGVTVETNYVRTLDASQERALKVAAERFSAFVGLPVTSAHVKK